jgi:hypothetical protein
MFRGDPSPRHRSPYLKIRYFAFRNKNRLFRARNRWFESISLGSAPVVTVLDPGHGEAIYRFKNGMLPSDFFRRNVVLSFQEDAIGIRLRDVIGPDNMIGDNMMWGSDYRHSESTFPQSRKILAEILAGVPDDEQAKIAGGNTARVYNFDVARLTVPA